MTQIPRIATVKVIQINHDVCFYNQIDNNATAIWTLTFCFYRRNNKPERKSYDVRNLNKRRTILKSATWKYQASFSNIYGTKHPWNSMRLPTAENTVQERSKCSWNLRERNFSHKKNLPQTPTPFYQKRLTMKCQMNYFGCPL